MWCNLMVVLCRSTARTIIELYVSIRRIFVRHEQVYVVIVGVYKVCIAASVQCPTIIIFVWCCGLYTVGR